MSKIALITQHLAIVDNMKKALECAIDAHDLGDKKAYNACISTYAEGASTIARIALSGLADTSNLPDVAIPIFDFVQK